MKLKANIDKNHPDLVILKIDWKLPSFLKILNPHDNFSARIYFVFNASMSKVNSILLSSDLKTKIVHNQYPHPN